MKERNESLDCLKGIAILLVMFGHVQVHNHMTDPYLYDVRLPIWSNIEKRSEDGQCLICFRSSPGWWCSI